ncbi:MULTISPECIES: ESPR-type extended signal peptide-containing protein [Haemophilus]|uniref:ESPR-type extended signal peptide-containing protein n=1 Tax=Haemophilus TaxID=724 RepID=UPI00080A8CBB|nr:MULTISPECIES: ESPR-type extended signal peptide-containing protein [Haemophilus]MDU3502013.1 ESPR-type extended signal peptide-containing protein [Haemophilus parainfluenzae]MDU4460942.1 ESPR-type extended signal peptide-containing protein [Haemophilus parainfluenzae]
MNKIFRVIWNHATQSWVAVSELASAKGKTKSKTISKLVAVSLVTCSSLMAEHAMAATYINQDKVSTTIADPIKQIAILQGSSQAAKNSDSTILISNNSLVRAGSVKIGFDIADNQDGNAGDTLIGNRISAGGQGGKDSMATAVGYGAQVAGPAVSLGIGARADIADSTGWNAVSNSGVAIGAFSSIGGNRNGGVAIGAIAQADNNGSIAIGQLSGAYREFFDRDATSQRKGTVYRNAESNAESTISIGKESGARATSSIALGNGATTSITGSNTIALGTNSVAIKNNSIALGNNAVAGGYSDSDITAQKTGINSKLENLKSDLATAETNLTKENEGLKTTDTPEQKFRVASATATVARIKLAIKRLENDLKYLASGTDATTDAIAIGNASRATNESALAFGNTANATGKASIAQGKQATVTAENAISIGTSSNVSGANSVALGANITKLTTENSVVLGANSTEVVGTTGASHAVQTVNDATVRTIAGPNFTYSGFVGKPADAGHYVSIGQKGSERQIKNLAAGAVDKNSTDAINGSQLYALMDRVENKQEPVVYTNKAGDKLVKVGDKFYKTTDLNDKGQPNNVNQNVPNDDVIASMNNAGNNTTTPMALANIAGNLPGAKKGSTAPTTSGKLPEGADAPNTSNAATVGDVLNAGWNLTEKGGARDFVKPYDTVDFIDGKGTSVNVTTDAGNKVSHIKYDVKAADDSITVGDDGIKVNTGGIAPVTKDEGDKKSGQVAPNKGDENKVASVGDVANAINNAFWKATGATDGGEFADGNNTTEEAVKAGDKVTFKAGKNIKLKQDGKNFTYSLNPELTDITSIGGKGTTMTFNPNGVDLGDKNITGVKSALNTTPVTTTPDGSPTPEADKPNLVDLVGTPDAPVNKNAAATVGDLQNMGWVVSSDKTTGALEKAYKDTVKNANEVKFIGTGAATVSGKTVDGIRTITVDVKQPETETLISTGGTVTNPEGDNANKLVTAGNVAEMINNSGFTLKADKVEGGENTTDGDNANNEKLTEKGELIKPGSTVTMKAGKNMTVKHEANGNITYATASNVTFDSVQFGENGPKITNKGGNINVGDKNGNPTQITGVASSLKTAPVETAPNGKDGAKPESKPNLVDLTNVTTPNAAATVGDLQNMGWIVGAPENGYVDTVKNANKVDFKGENGISVTGKTNDKGVREITISVAEGKVTNDVNVTKADGTVVNGVKGPDGKLYEKGQDGKPDTSKPITLAEGDKVNNEGSKFVSGNAVATAIQESGWNIGKADAKDVTKAFEKEAKVHDKVNPNDDVKFVDGQNTVVKMVTVDAKNEDGSKKATTFVKVDVTGLPVQYTDKNGTPVTKVGDKYFTVDDKGNPTTTEVAPADLTTNMVNPAAKPNEIGAPTTLGNVKSNLPSVNDADKNAKDVDGNPIAGKDNKSAPIGAAKAADIAKNAGNNAATVSDVLNAGWNLQNNGKDKDFVKPYDTVNFVDGKGTKAVVKTEEDGTTSNVKFDIDTGSITNNVDGSVQGPVVTPEMTKALEDATNTLNNLPANAPASVRKAAEQAVADAANNIANVANKVATAQDVANAINKSGFTLTTSANGGEKISGTPEMINPGKKVEMVAGKNMTVKQESNGKVTYATASNVTFDSVQFGDNGPKITNNGGNINVGTATGAPTKITGVAPGEISATSKDAVNGSQLHAMGNKLQGQINKLGNRMNAGMATSAAMANLLQPHKPGQSVATAGVGQHKNQSAVAVGYSRISDNGKYGVRFSMGANTQGEVTGGAAVGYFW